MQIEEERLEDSECLPTTGPLDNDDHGGNDGRSLLTYGFSSDAQG